MRPNGNLQFAPFLCEIWEFMRLSRLDRVKKFRHPPTGSDEVDAINPVG